MKNRGFTGFSFLWDNTFFFLGQRIMNHQRINLDNGINEKIVKNYKPLSIMFIFNREHLQKVEEFKEDPLEVLTDHMRVRRLS